MSFVGIVTNLGLSQTQLAALNQGWYIFPSGFGVSSTAGPLDPTRTSPNAGNWYGTLSQPGPISGRVVENFNTVKFICTIPPGEASQVTNVNEIYLYTAGYAFLNYDGVTYTALNPGTVGNSIQLVFNGSLTNQQVVNNWNMANPSNQVGISSGPATNVSPANTLMLSGGGNAVLFAIGEASPTIQYDPTGQLTLELTVGVLNSNLTSQIVFDYTQATEVADHNVDPLAHPDIQQALDLAAIFPTAGQAPFSYSGQTYDQLAVFDGTPASGTYQGVTYTAVRNGPLGNSITLTFDGIQTINNIVYNWNLNNPDNAVSDNASNGNVVPTAGNVTLAGGTLNVNDGDLVYSNDGVYYQAIANGTAAQNVAGIANLTYNKVVAIGFYGITTGYPVGTALYLSATNPGKITNTITAVQIGTQIYSSPDVILIINHGSGGGSFGAYNAVVTNVAGLNNYPTTQDAIDAVGSGASILVAKLEAITSEILTNSKQLNFFFLGPETGWTKAVGTQEVQEISFNAVPTGGTWRIYWNGFVGPDLAYNASASDVATVFDGFGQTGMVVTGNYSSGFTLTYPNVGPEPLPAFTNPGQNAFQTISFSAVPTDGCFQIQFLGNPFYTTVFFCYNNTLSQLQSFTDAVLGAGNSVWTGSFSSGFTIQYESSLGLQPIALLQVLNNGLLNGITPVVATVTQPQPGLYPANNLKIGSTPITITVTELHLGTVNGPATCIQLTEDECNFLNNGLIYGFENGIDFNGTTGHHIEMIFDPSVSNPILSYASVPGRDFSIEGSVGQTNSDIPGLRVFQHPTDQYRVIITAVDYTNFQGGTLAQILNDQLLVFSGAQIDFSTGNIYASDGITIIGGFSPVSIPFNEFVWYTLALQPGSVNGDNTINGVIQILPGTPNSSLTLANKPSFQTGTIPLALVYNQQGSGSINPVLQANVYEVSMGATSIYEQATAFPQPYFVQEIPGGVINGSNVTFTLSQTPKTPYSLLFFVDDLPIPVSTYSLVGPTVTLSSAPQTGQSVYAYYVANSPSPIYAYQEIPSGVINGENALFGLTSTPTSQASTLVFVDDVQLNLSNWGLIQVGNQYFIQFQPGYIPQTAQSVYVFYLINLATAATLPLVELQNESGGVGIYDYQEAGIAYIKSLINGPGIQIIDNGEGGIVIKATGGGGGGSVPWVSENSAASPLNITASGGFTPSPTDPRQVWFLSTAGGEVIVTASPQIAPGGFDGQELLLKGTSNVNYPVFTPSTGLDLNGPCSITFNQVLWLVWNELGNFWFEAGRRA